MNDVLLDSEMPGRVHSERLELVADWPTSRDSLERIVATEIDTEHILL